MASFLGLMVIDEVRVGLLGPATRRLILLAGEYADGDWNLDAFCVEESTLIFPIETRRRHARVSQPIQRDVVENFVARQFACCARTPVQRCSDCRGGLSIGVVVIE